jgi:hypothetical protein
VNVLKYKSLSGFFAAVLGAAISYSSSAELPLLSWSKNIKPGITEAELTTILKSLGVRYYDGGKGLTYTSSINTDIKDYLFCQDRLYAIVEGAFAGGTEFNEWFDAFLLAHREYGKPVRYEAMKDWGRFIAVWKLRDGSTLYFQLQSNLKDKQGWSRQLYSSDIGASCLEK